MPLVKVQPVHHARHERRELAAVGVRVLLERRKAVAQEREAAVALAVAVGVALTVPMRAGAALALATAGRATGVALATAGRATAAAVALAGTEAIRRVDGLCDLVPQEGKSHERL